MAVFTTGAFSFGRACGDIERKAEPAAFRRYHGFPSEVPPVVGTWLRRSWPAFDRPEPLYDQPRRNDTAGLRDAGTCSPDCQSLAILPDDLPRSCRGIGNRGTPPRSPDLVTHAGSLHRMRTALPQRATTGLPPNATVVEPRTETA